MSFVAVSAFDHHMMGIALRLAARGLGTTAPNPAVGAIIVDPTTGEVVARGWTQPTGRPHAETEAIARASIQATARARGATMYVTLEPCSHHGKTPPCAEAVIAAGLARVVVGIEDPDPRVAGRGIAMLRAAGIETVRGVRSEEAHRVTLGHIVRVTERRPFVQLKMALGSDGIAPQGADGKPVWVTGPEARAHGHLLRARADAILVGARTVADDDPELTCRLPGLAARSPVRVVLGGEHPPAATSRLVTTARQTPVWIFLPASSDAATCARLEAAGCRVFQVATVAGRLWLPAVMERLVAEGITRLLVEGGAATWQAFCRAGFVDEIVEYRAPGSDGRHADITRVLHEIATLAPHLGFEPVSERRIGTDMIYVLSRKRGS